MNDPQSAETHAVRLFQVILDHRFYFASGNRVQIENIGDGNANEIFFVHNCC